MTVGIILVGAYLFREGNVTTGAIIASVILSGRAVSPLGQLAMTLARFRQALQARETAAPGDLTRIQELIRAGAADVVPHPPKHNTLARKLARALRKSKTPRTT